jgi:hypothetical protein
MSWPMSSAVDPKIQELAERIIAEGKNKRAIAVLKALLDRGSISTDELNDLGYNHPPRAVGDVRDVGIPIIKVTAISKRTGRSMAIYSFGDASQIQNGRIGGRSALPKKFKAALIIRYRSRDCITGAQLDERVLQIDHRIPYRIAGDKGLDNQDVEAYMLLDASSQRAKSWSCEACPNMRNRDEAVCKRCYWAFPEDYDHIATAQIRRIDVVWQNHEVEDFKRIELIASAKQMTVADFLKNIASQIANDA